MKNVTDSFIDLVTQTTYENIPKEVLHETKRALLDSFGCALGGISSDKGKIGISMAKKMGGIPEATLMGVGGKYSAGVAAFANSELMNGLDMDIIPHIPPVVFPAILAVAETKKSSGKDFLAAAVIAQEISMRISRGTSTMMASLAKKGTTPDVFSNSNEYIIGAAVGCAMLMGLPIEKIAQALGISAYMCSLPVCKDWESTMPKALIKYAPTAWLAQGAIQAAMLAEEGYTGNAYTLDSEYGFPKIITSGEDVWTAEKVLKGIGEEWTFVNYRYKAYPCCSFIHSILDSFYSLQEQYAFSPVEIQAIRCHSEAFVAHPDQYAVENQIDAQFSIPYSVAMAAFGYKIGPAWQDKGALTDPKVREFMKKVTVFVSPKGKEMRKTDPKVFYANVEIDARGKTFNAETYYAKGTNKEGYLLTDEDLIEKFKVNASAILPDEKINKAINAFMNLERLNDINELTRTLSL